eukprot:scaffold1187_cov258-Pinguiococcus_pyrenoidosus.AAC.4
MEVPSIAEDGKGNALDGLERNVLHLHVHHHLVLHVEVVEEGATQASEIAIRAKGTSGHPVLAIDVPAKCHQSKQHGLPRRFQCHVRHPLGLLNAERQLRDAFLRRHGNPNSREVPYRGRRALECLDVAA